MVITAFWEDTDDCFIDIINANDTQVNNELAWKCKFILNSEINWPYNQENKRNIQSFFKKQKQLLYVLSYNKYNWFDILLLPKSPGMINLSFMDNSNAMLCVK